MDFLPKVDQVRASLAQSSEAMNRLFHSSLVLEQILSASEAILKSYQRGGSLFVAGNGGSAADAQHFVAELVVKLDQDRDPIRAFALTVDTSILTAIGNDYSFEKIFERQVQGLMTSNDLFFAITTSGNSKNILAALQACKNKGVSTLLLTGESGGKARELADGLITVPASRTSQIQECHLAVYHVLCALIERDLVSHGLCQYRPS